MGVLGVLAVRFGGVVAFRPSTSEEGAGNEAILAVLALLKGRRFKGGSRRG
jgi:hypothetical protein